MFLADSGQHLVREVGDGDPQMGVPEVDTECDASRLLEREEHRRAPTLLAVGDAGRVHLLGDEAGLQEIRDDARHRRAGKTGGPGNLGAARGAAAAEGIDDTAAVQFAKRTKRAGIRGPHCRGSLTNHRRFVKSLEELRPEAGPVCQGSDKPCTYQPPWGPIPCVRSGAGPLEPPPPPPPPPLGAGVRRDGLSEDRRRVDGSALTRRLGRGLSGRGRLRRCGRRRRRTLPAPLGGPPRLSRGHVLGPRSRPVDCRQGARRGRDGQGGLQRRSAAVGTREPASQDQRDDDIQNRDASPQPPHR